MKLLGTCNQCGRCCFVGNLRCVYLMMRPGAAIGTPNATACVVHDRRIPGMEILLINPKGVAEGLGTCCHGTPQDDERIAQEIGKGCSLSLQSSPIMEP